MAKKTGPSTMPNTPTPAARRPGRKHHELAQADAASDESWPQKIIDGADHGRSKHGESLVVQVEDDADHYEGRDPGPGSGKIA